MEGAPRLDKILDGLLSTLGSPDAMPQSMTMTDHNAEWDVIYPKSQVSVTPLLRKAISHLGQYIAQYSFTLPAPTSSEAVAHDGKITVRAVKNAVDEQAGTRILSLVIEHPGLIWPGRPAPFSPCTDADSS
jgi:hypothetical protein